MPFKMRFIAILRQLYALTHSTQIEGVMI
jgi:hypothetical protein